MIVGLYLIRFGLNIFHVRFIETGITKCVFSSATHLASNTSLYIRLVFKSVYNEDLKCLFAFVSSQVYVDIPNGVSLPFNNWWEPNSDVFTSHKRCVVQNKNKRIPEDSYKVFKFLFIKYLFNFWNHSEKYWFINTSKDKYNYFNYKYNALWFTVFMQAIFFNYWIGFNKYQYKWKDGRKYGLLLHFQVPVLDLMIIPKCEFMVLLFCCCTEE